MAMTKYNKKNLMEQIRAVGGKRVIATWRKANPGVQLNLSRTDLRGADLSEANLYGANLYGADLYGADLRKARLYGTNLHKANFRRARISGTILAVQRFLPPLLQIWDASCPERRAHLLQALQNQTALRGMWSQGTARCPEGYLLGGKGAGDWFTRAWDTGAISHERLLKLLRWRRPKTSQEASV